MNMENITKKRLIHDLEQLGIRAGFNLFVSSALSEIGWVDGGVQTVLDSLLEAVGEQGTIFGNAYTHLHKLPLGKQSSKEVYNLSSKAYTGSLINLMIDDQRSIRSRHPSCSVVGIGPLANELLKDHDASSPAYSPVNKLAAYSNSKYLKLGTTTKSPGTTITHLVQNRLRFKNLVTGKYGINYEDESGSEKLYIRDYVGGCSRGFGKFYERYQKEGALLAGNVGNAHSILVDIKKALSIDMEILKETPDFFFCDDPFCYSCRVSWEFSPESRLFFKFKQLSVKLSPALKKWFK